MKKLLKTLAWFLTGTYANPKNGFFISHLKAEYMNIK